jgi:PAS domain S-box-containing protein
MRSDCRQDSLSSVETSKEERLQLALDAAQLGTFVWYVEDRGEPDQRMRELFNLPNDGGLSLPATLTPTIHPDDRGRYIEAVAAALDPAGSRELREDFRVRQAHGGYHWIEVTAHASFAGDPLTPTRLVGVAADVTDRYEAEARRGLLFELSETLRRLTDPLDIKAHAVDRLGRHLEVSRALYIDVAHEPDGDYYVTEHGFHGPGVAGIAGRYRADELGAALFADWRAGHAIAVNDVTDDLRLSDSERQAYPASSVRAFAAVPLVKAGSHVASLMLHQNEPRAWTPAEMELVEEVAERTWAAVERAKAEKDLRDSELRFREVIEVTPQLVWVGRLDGSVEFVNNNWITATGIHPDGLKHRAMLFAATHPDDADELATGWAAAESQGNAFEGELRLRQQSGSYRWFLVRIVPMSDGAGAVLKWFGVATDIDDRRRAEEVLREQERMSQRARLRADLLANIISDLDSAPTIAGGIHRLAARLASGFSGRAAVTDATHQGGITIATDRDSGVKLVVEFDDHVDDPHHAEDVAFLHDLAARAAVSLNGVRVRQEEHRVALALQRALLPRAIASSPHAAIHALYEAGGVALEVGGDWYDAYTLGDGRIALTVGDVVGHGLDAAITMGTLRVAMAALAPQATRPGELLSQFDRFAAGIEGADFTTACYAIYDPAAGQLAHASAGHPPILVIDADGSTRWLSNGRSGPINGHVDANRPDAIDILSPGSTLVLYSDGLIERRREPITVGLDRLAQTAAQLHSLPIDQFCDQLIEALGVGTVRTDDAVILCLRIPSPDFRREFQAKAGELRHLRRSLTDWAAQRRMPDAVVRRLLIAVNEAAANAIEHAYRQKEPETVTVAAHEDSGHLTATVTDTGTWKPVPRQPGDRGRGTNIMRQVSNDFERHTGPAGTTVQLRFSPTGPSA